MSRMRDSQIMFRIFDKEVDEMVDQYMHVFGESIAFDLVESWIQEHGEAKGDETILERYDDMVLMQYTGLRDNTKWGELTEKEKDKWYNRESDWEGKFVYEGDIITVYDDKNFVYFQDGAFWVNLDKTKGVRLLANLRGEGIEVVGNKFENPEVLD